MARLARGDVNMHDYDGFPLQVQVQEVMFEVAVYELLRSEPEILASRLLYYRIPVQHVGPRRDVPPDTVGRRLFLFEKAEGGEFCMGRSQLREKGAYSCQYIPCNSTCLCNLLQACLLAQVARIRASPFNFDLPLDFATTWLRQRLFEQKPKLLPIPVAPTREFCVSLFTSKIEATIGNISDMIGWEDDNNTVGPIVAVAKNSLLHLIPHIMPTDGDQTSLYRLVLERGDFGIHNMSITSDATGQPLVMSLYDWETGCIVPAILSDLLMAVWVDLVPDMNAALSYTRVPKDATPDDHLQYMAWSRQYFTVCPLSSIIFLIPPHTSKKFFGISLRRLSLIKHQITNLLSVQEKMHGTSGSRCESGEEATQRGISGS